MTKCFRCRKEIKDIDDFSIEHKNPWLYSDNPRKLFFDIKNIAFSHLSCNRAFIRHRFKVVSRSGYKGVYYDSSGGHNLRPWRAVLVTKTKKVDIGRFITAIAVASAYDKVVLKYYPKRAVTNKMLRLI